MKKYRTASMDPPWLERGGGKIKRGADKHYSLMKKEDILSAVKNSGHWNMEDNSHLYLWVTGKYLPDGLWLMKQLEFNYINNVVWNKSQISIGQYFRGKHELMLFGVRGKGLDSSVCTEARNIPTSFDAPCPRDANGKRIHSRKPDKSYEFIESRSKGPYIEFFARRQWNENWTVWGNEVTTKEEEQEED